MYRYPDPEAIEVLGPGNTLPNIAMAIDPTYSPHATVSSPHQTHGKFIIPNIL